ncbi:MAG: RdgB/HAM1 family non-canonical purine NTP pyrophosphatase [Candidatus Tumulicola sp.]
MKAYVATKNSGKLAEMRAIFAGSPLELDVYEAYANVVEDADSYVGNALLKARALAQQLAAAGIGAAAIADDSGLEVDALGGRPGVYSARYGGADASWTQRRARLLNEMHGLPDPKRGARFVSAMALVLPGGAELTSLGTVAGRIGTEAFGAGGFGYDPLFYYVPRGCTFAELSPAEKNAVSHRRAAAEELLQLLRRQHG